MGCIISSVQECVQVLHAWLEVCGLMSVRVASGIVSMGKFEIPLLTSLDSIKCEVGCISLKDSECVYVCIYIYIYIYICVCVRMYT